jgi:hypothetical protein
MNADGRRWDAGQVRRGSGIFLTTVVRLLASQPGQSEEDARALVLQVKGHDYNPPKRERILEWQAQQEFPICPTPDDPRSCNVYRELRFPDGIYDHIEEFWEERAA